MMRVLLLSIAIAAANLEWNAIPTIGNPGDGTFDVIVSFKNIEDFAFATVRCWTTLFVDPAALYYAASPIPLPLGMLPWDREIFWSNDWQDHLLNGKNLSWPLDFNVNLTLVQPTDKINFTYKVISNPHHVDIYAVKCSAIGWREESNGYVPGEAILPLFTNPAMILAEDTSHITSQACYQDLQIYEDPTLWPLYANHTPHYDFDSMSKKSAKFGGTSMGDYAGCQSLDNARYCSLRYPGLTWTGLCLPSSCNIDNIKDVYRVSSSQAIVQLGTSNLLSLQLTQNETMTELDMYLAQAGITPAMIDQVNKIIPPAAIGIVGISQNPLQEYTTIWFAVQTTLLKWECGDNEKWPAVVAAWWIPFFLLIGVVGCATLLDTQWTYKTHQFNKRVNSVGTGGYENLVDSSTVASGDGTGREGEASSPDLISSEDAKGSAPPVKTRERSETDIWNPETAMDHVICAFSLQRSWETFLKARGGKLAFFDGIRVYAAWWVILGHTEFWVLVTTWFGNSNAIYPSKSTSDSTSFWWQIIPGAFFAVDTFFFIGGFFATFIMVKKASKMKIPTFGAAIPIFYLERWLRLVPSIFFAMLAQAYLLPNIGSGPLWPYSGVDYRCEKAWWSELFMLTSWPTYDATKKAEWSCLGVTWYLTCDFFYFTITPFVVLCYAYGHRYAGYAAAAICIIAFSVKYTILADEGDIHVNALFNTGTGWSYTYDNPRCRGAPYFWGVMCGMMYDHLRAEYKDFKISGISSMITQSCAFLIIFFCVFTPYWDTKDAECAPQDPRCDWEDPWPQSTHTFFAVYSRFFFVVALSMYAACWIYGPETSYTRQFMTLPFWPQLGKLSFLMYLWHPFWLSWYYGTQPAPIYYSRLNMLVWWLGISGLAMGTALFFHLNVEIPCNYICNLAPWRPKKK